MVSMATGKNVDVFKTITVLNFELLYLPWRLEPALGGLMV